MNGVTAKRINTFVRKVKRGQKGQLRKKEREKF